MQSNKIIVIIILLAGSSLNVLAQHQGIQQLDKDTAAINQLRTNDFLNHFLTEVYPIFEIGRKHLFQMSFVQYNHLIKTFPSY